MSTVKENTRVIDKTKANYYTNTWNVNKDVSKITGRKVSALLLTTSITELGLKELELRKERLNELSILFNSHAIKFKSIARQNGLTIEEVEYIHDNLDEMIEEIDKALAERPQKALKYMLFGKDAVFTQMIEHKNEIVGLYRDGYSFMDICEELDLLHNKHSWEAFKQKMQEEKIYFVQGVSGENL